MSRRLHLSARQQLSFLLLIGAVLAFEVAGHSASALAACEPNAEQASFYADANFRGACVMTGVADFPTANRIGLPNNSILSLKVGVEAVVDPTKQLEAQELIDAFRATLPNLPPVSPSPTGSISGTVINADTQEPLSERVIRVAGSEILARTDNNGNFTLEGIPQGSQTVLFNITGFQDDVTRTVTVVPGQSVFVGRIELKVRTFTGTFIGQVVVDDTTRAPIQGATVAVTVAATGKSFQTQTDSEGNFEFLKFPAGFITITVSKPGFTSKTLPGQVKEDRTASAGAIRLVPNSEGAVTPSSFYVVHHSGKCLDFGPSPQKSGTPIVLSACNDTASQQVVVQEINERHEVILRAGAKVIGVKQGAAGGPSISAPGPTQLGTHQPVSLSEMPLELQDSSGVGQLFSLDGDSIILVGDRTRVVKVQNHRGMNGTPLVLGHRELADNEFSTFQPADKSNRTPTSGFVRVPQDKDLLTALSDVDPTIHAGAISQGTVIEILTDIDLTGQPALHIPSGVTIRGDRRGTLLGPEVRTSQFNPNMFEIDGNDVRVTGLRLRGPSRGTDDDIPGATGILIHSDLISSPVLIDHNDMSDWSAAAISVNGSDPSTTCNSPDDRDPRAILINVRIVRNFLHHNRRQNLGYGVVASYGGWAAIEGNTFLSNRHAIAGGGQANTIYRAWYNLVLQDTPIQNKYGAHWHTQDFDMHGTGDGGFGGTAGLYIEIARNTFLGTKTGVTWTVIPLPFSPGTTHPNFHLRGTPCFQAEYHDNVSREKLEDAINNDGDKPVVVSNNQFESPNPSSRFGIGDFDGDGADDLFLATGAAWYYAPQANAEWRLLNTQTDPIGNLLFGDFDGDGRTDVFTQYGRDWLVSWGGASSWEKINESNPALSEFRIGDFNGDHLADIFYTDNNQWYISYGGTTPLTAVNSSSIGVLDLGFGDFNGDGKTDVVASTSGQWMVSLSATEPWAGWPLRAALTNTMAGLIISDFNGDGFADIATYDGKVSYDGRNDWSKLRSFSGDLAGVGRFDVHPGADIIFFQTNTNYLTIHSSGNGAPVLQSRQDMR